IKLFRMTEKSGAKEDFADVVRRIRAKEQLSLQDVETRSQGRIDKSYVSQIENRGVLGTDLTLKKIKALADGLSTSPDILIAAAWGKLPETEVEEDKKLLNWMFEDLPRECQLDVMASVTGIHQRRSMSASIRERHDAREVARHEINQRGKNLPDNSSRRQSSGPKTTPTTKRRKSGSRHVAATFAGVENPQSEAASDVHHEKRRTG
ncbi:MAG: helix-turn-helix transcriptional regulator, partial [Pyrinomonadaceae bacterium]